MNLEKAWIPEQETEPTRRQEDANAEENVTGSKTPNTFLC
jgi:hypothetical protein